MAVNKVYDEVQLDVEFTQASTRENLVSKENISISFGKISKYFADLHSQAFTGYTHPTYTARTGKPTGNQTPGFGATFTISQITSDGTGHVTGATDRTVKIPNTTMGAATADAAGSIGLVPAPAAGKQTSFLRGDGTWVVPTNTNTTYTLSGAYGSSSNTWVTTLTPSSGNATTSTVPTASTSVYGITKLSSATNSTSTALAATPSAVKSAYDLANGKSTVSFSASLTSGTKVGTITIDGTATDIYCSTVNNAALTLKGAGTTVTTFTANASSAKSLDIVAGSNVTVTADATNAKISIASSHPTITKSTDTTSTASPAHGGTFTTVDSVTRDGNGHVTKINTKTVTLPADSNTDTKVSQTADNSNNSDSYELLISNSANNTTETAGVRKSARLRFNPSTGRVIMQGPLIVRATDGVGSYDEGIRINAGKNGYSSLSFGGGQDTISGTADGQFWIGTNSTNDSYKRKLYIAHATSTSSGTYFYASSATQGSPALKLGTSGSIASGNGDAVTGGVVYTALSNYLPLSGGTMTGDITFASISGNTYPISSKGIKWGGGTDAIDMYYNLRESDAGELIINMRDDSNVRISFAYNGTVKSYIDTNGTYNGNASTATKLGTANKGSTTKGIYLDAGVPKEMTYSLGSTVNAGTANQLAYYSGANAISATHDGTNTNNSLYFKTGTNAKSARQIILGIYGQAYGNDASTLISGTAGVFSYGDGGPQIDFNTSSSGSQAGALIFTDHDTAGAGASWHFVSNQGDWNVTSKRFHARTGISIGTDKPTTSYNLYVNGTTYITGATTITNSSFAPFKIIRSGSTASAAIAFANSNNTLGYIGMTGSANGGLYRWNTDTNIAYRILDDAISPACKAIAQRCVLFGKSDESDPAGWKRILTVPASGTSGSGKGINDIKLFVRRHYNNTTPESFSVHIINNYTDTPAIHVLHAMQSGKLCTKIRITKSSDGKFNHVEIYYNATKRNAITIQYNVIIPYELSNTAYNGPVYPADLTEISNISDTVTAQTTIDIPTNTAQGNLKNANGFWGMALPDGTDTDWIRTTSNGIIPYQSGGAGSGHGKLGTSSWYFSEAYIDTVHGSLSGNATNVTGTVAIAHGGTGATTRLAALRALTGENVGTSAQYFLTITDSYGKGGYTSVADAKTVLGLKSAAYTASTDYLSSSTKYAGSSSAGGPALSVSTAGGDVVLGTPSSSSDDSGDILWKYGNGQEKARLWQDNTYTAKAGPTYRIYKSDGTSLYSGRLPLADGTSASGTWGISITGNAATATRADYVNVVGSNEIRFYNDNQFKANSLLWIGYSWAQGSHYTPSGGSDTSSRTAPNITKFLMGNCSAGGLASVHAKTFILGNGSSPTGSSKTTTITTAATTTDRTITLPDDSGTVALTSKTFNVTRGSSVSTATAGYWAAMCNSSGTGSPVLPTSGKFWHVISMDWNNNDTKNWISQLAIATQDGSGVWWRRNDTGGTSIDSFSWHRLAEGDSSGAATSANKLNTNAGTTSIPVYFSGGVPVQCTTPNAYQTNTTTNADYRVLFSTNANDTTQSGTTRKNINLKYNPSTATLKIGDYVSGSTATKTGKLVLGNSSNIYTHTINTNTDKLSNVSLTLNSTDGIMGTDALCYKGYESANLSSDTVPGSLADISSLSNTVSFSGYLARFSYFTVLLCVGTDVTARTTVQVSAIAGYQSYQLIWGGAPTHSGGNLSITSGLVNITESSGTITLNFGKCTAYWQFSSASSTPTKGTTPDIHILKVYGHSIRSQGYH